jgi:hypothetical protein
MEMNDRYDLAITYPYETQVMRGEYMCTIVVLSLGESLVDPDILKNLNLYLDNSHSHHATVTLIKYCKTL